MSLRGVGIAAGVALAAALVFWVSRRGAAGVGAAVGQAAGQLATGAVLGAGDAVGIPRTEASACDRAIAEGRTWDASFACPAGRFIGSLFGGGASDRAEAAADTPREVDSLLGRYPAPISAPTRVLAARWTA